MNLQRGQVLVHPEDNLLRVRGREGGREGERERVRERVSERVRE